MFAYNLLFELLWRVHGSNMLETVCLHKTRQDKTIAVSELCLQPKNKQTKVTDDNVI